MEYKQEHKIGKVDRFQNDLEKSKPEIFLVNYTKVNYFQCLKWNLRRCATFAYWWKHKLIAGITKRDAVAAFASLAQIATMRSFHFAWTLLLVGFQTFGTVEPDSHFFVGNWKYVFYFIGVTDRRLVVLFDQ